MKTKNTQHPTFLSSTIPNPKERRSIIVYFIFTFCIAGAAISLISFYYDHLMLIEEDHYKEFFKQFGSIARVVYFAVLSIFPVFLLMKWKGLREVKWRNLELKRPVQYVGRLLRKFHVPLALLGTAIVIVHGTLAVIRDFHWDFTNVTGILSSIVLCFLVYMGFKRFKRKDGAWHLKLAFIFTILFMIHASF
ncbi:hypothetical protein LCL96_06005 [Rossellomorea aquimaris]|uniref:hypothetical protein n=1 Tax=Rossellomorea TaxID=2837508 RepID=UPI001CD333C3|nr:hypothetical protein [Rossellomorea aquimaris]MCA1058478.1 hypothetical protein [Rossellomorea aquimaris]